VKDPNVGGAWRRRSCVVHCVVSVELKFFYSELKTCEHSTVWRVAERKTKNSCCFAFLPAPLLDWQRSGRAKRLLRLLRPIRRETGFCHASLTGMCSALDMVLRNDC
jgi:hypothetical protein